MTEQSPPNMPTAIYSLRTADAPSNNSETSTYTLFILSNCLSYKAGVVGVSAGVIMLGSVTGMKSPPMVMRGH